VSLDPDDDYDERDDPAPRPERAERDDEPYDDDLSRYPFTPASGD
jgi:hypothetical protein